MYDSVVCVLLFAWRASLKDIYEDYRKTENIFIFDILKMSNNNAQSKVTSVFRHRFFMAWHLTWSCGWVSQARWTAEEGFGDKLYSLSRSLIMRGCWRCVLQRFKFFRRILFWLDLSSPARTLAFPLYSITYFVCNIWQLYFICKHSPICSCAHSLFNISCQHGENFLLVQKSIPQI